MTKNIKADNNGKILKVKKAIDKKLQLQDNKRNLIAILNSDDWEERQNVHAQRAGGWCKPAGDTT